MGSVFKFKEFEVNQEGCAMKINTDGVLLGSLVEAGCPVRILDVGSGTGVIAMMLAQRFPEALVDAIDIDEVAFFRSEENFLKSQFADRMIAYCGDFETLEPSYRYDLIVSNPPFYINTLHNPDQRKRLARHTDLDFFKRLIRFSKERLVEGGTLQLILPADLSDEIKVYTDSEELMLTRTVNVQSFSDTEIIRKVLTFSKSENDNKQCSNFVIYHQKGIYSKDYRSVLKPFFLAF